jgi:hypothetical protein
MKDFDDRIWNLLTKDEKLALSLKYGHNKSSWESGEIMKRAHYKYLEIEARALAFARILSEHLRIYNEIIPKYIKMDKRIRQYFKLTIVKRMRVVDAVKEINDVEFNIMSVRDRIIIEQMKKFLRARKVMVTNFATMIFDFDRWNNFRILPREIQEPSAFKRRNKNSDKRNIKNILSINSFVIEQIIKTYEFNGDSEKILWLPIYSRYLEQDNSIIRIRREPAIIRKLSNIGLYLFPRKEHAEDFYKLLDEYDIENPKHCKDGQRFWPKYRLVIRNSLNFNRIQKIIPSRKYLETALRDMDINWVNPKNKANKSRRKNNQSEV